MVSWLADASALGAARLDLHRAHHRVRHRGFILAQASLALLWPFAPMHQREVLAAGGGTSSDTVHQALAAVTVFLMFLAIGFGATAFGKRFRLYSIVNISVFLLWVVALGAMLWRTGSAHRDLAEGGTS